MKPLASERYKIQFRAESFNLSNTPQFDSFNMGITQGNDDFGQIHGTLPGTERHTQFAQTERSGTGAGTTTVNLEIVRLLPLARRVRFLD